WRSCSVPAPRSRAARRRRTAPAGPSARRAPARSRPAWRASRRPPSSTAPPAPPPAAGATPAGRPGPARSTPRPPRRRRPGARRRGCRRPGKCTSGSGSWMDARRIVKAEAGRSPGSAPGDRREGVSGAAVGRPRLAHQGVVVAEDLDHFRAALAGGGDLVPKFDRGVLHHPPLLVRDRRQLQLVAVDAQVRLAAPVPPLAVIVRAVDAQVEQLLEVVGDLVPALGIGEVRADPGA